MNEFKGWEELSDKELGFDKNYIDLDVLEKIYYNWLRRKWKIIKENEYEK